MKSMTWSKSISLVALTTSILEKSGLIFQISSEEFTMILKNFNVSLLSLLQKSELPNSSVKNTVNNSLLFISIFVSIFSANSKSCFGAGFTNVFKGTFDGGSYDILQRHNDEGRLLEQTFYNFQNKTGLDANDFHVTLVTYSGSVNSIFPIVTRVDTFNFPDHPDELRLPGTVPFLVPDGAYFSPTGYLQHVFQGGQGTPNAFIQDVYWTFNGQRLGAPPNPVTGNPPIGVPSISGNNSYCITPKSNLACKYGTVGNKPLEVPEPVTTLGSVIAVGFGTFLRKKYSRQLNKQAVS
jgi:hypothetical protein